MKLWKWHKLWS